MKIAEVSIMFIVMMQLNTCAQMDHSFTTSTEKKTVRHNKLDTATWCRMFWCIEAIFSTAQWCITVNQAIVEGNHKSYYQEVCSGNTETC